MAYESGAESRNREKGALPDFSSINWSNFPDASRLSPVPLQGQAFDGTLLWHDFPSTPSVRKKLHARSSNFFPLHPAIFVG